jgi:hypothetical protein
VLRNRHKAGLMNGEVVTVLDVGRESAGFLTMTVAAEGRLPVEIKAPVEPLLGDDADARACRATR